MRLRIAAELLRHHTSSSALQQFPPKRLPGDRSLRVRSVSFQAAVKLRPLGIRKLKDLRSIRDAVPKILDELDPLGHGQVAEVEKRICHDRNLHMARPRHKSALMAHQPRQQPRQLRSRHLL